MTIEVEDNLNHSLEVVASPETRNGHVLVISGHRSPGQTGALNGTEGCTQCPPVENISVNKSKRVHIGPKFVSVTQNVTNNEVVKGRIFGLDLHTSKPSRSCRSSVVVFVCWTFFVACGVCALILYIMIPHQTRLDIGLDALWYLRRADWQAMPAYETSFLGLPLQYVMFGHSAEDNCSTKYQCIREVLKIQQDHLRLEYGDIGPNFLVGGKGYIFEGRGANIRGAMVKLWNIKSISIMFLDLDFGIRNDFQKDEVLRFDMLEVTLGRYLVKAVKNSTRAERIGCFVAGVALIISIGLIVFFVIRRNSLGHNEDLDPAPNDLFITREMWLATEVNPISNDEYKPLRLVIINHTAGAECVKFAACAAYMRNLQRYFLEKMGYDFPYNFAIGNDARAYEGRGWGVWGAHTRLLNVCSLGIGFTGDYRPDSMNTQLTDRQVEKMNELLEYGVKNGYLHPDYVIVGARDLNANSESPGLNLYNRMHTWKHYDNQRYKQWTCKQIYSSEDKQE